MQGKFEIDISDNDKKAEVAKRVRAIIGVPDGILTDEVIVSPVFIIKAEKYVNDAIKEILEVIDENDLSLLEVGAMYYIGSLLCVGMDARLPKQMENLSTKTILQNINWDEKAIELRGTADDVIFDVIDEYNEGVNYYSTFAELSVEQDYPASNI